MNLSQEDLTELQRRYELYETAESTTEPGSGLNIKYEAKKYVDQFSKEMATKYGYDYTKHGINRITGAIIPL